MEDATLAKQMLGLKSLFLTSRDKGFPERTSVIQRLSCDSFTAATFASMPEDI